MTNRSWHAPRATLRRPPRRRLPLFLESAESRSDGQKTSKGANNMWRRWRPSATLDRREDVNSFHFQQESVEHVWTFMRINKMAKSNGWGQSLLLLGQNAIRRHAWARIVCTTANNCEAGGPVCSHQAWPSKQRTEVRSLSRRHSQTVPISCCAMTRPCR